MHMLPATGRGIFSNTSSAIRTNLRIGFLSTVNPNNPDALSGMPYQMQTALKSRGASIVRLGTTLPVSNRSMLNKFVPRGLIYALPNTLQSSLRSVTGESRKCFESTFSRHTYQMVLSRARVTSRLIEQEIARLDLDVVFGCCISSLLYDLNVSAPIVYFSDATARLINENYPRYIRRSKSYKESCNELERGALSRVAAGVFASQWARSSAISDYGLTRECAFVVPMGANVLPDMKQDHHLVISPPRPDSLELCIVGADPWRKRLDFAIDTTCRLQAKGINTRLTYIGPPTRNALNCRFVNCAGRLHISNAQDRDLYRGILRESHLMLLPSSGEAFGIAPCEAAHFGLPSVVSDAGGLPEVVQDNITGIVLPLSANADSYASRIAKLIGEPERYYSMCIAAQNRAVERLSWDRWAEDMVGILEMTAVSARRSSLLSV